MEIKDIASFLFCTLYHAITPFFLRGGDRAPTNFVLLLSQLGLFFA